MAEKHLTAAECQDYIARRGDRGELLAHSDHLAECAACRTRVFDSLGAEGGRVQRGETLEISYELLVALLNDELEPLACHELTGKIEDSAAARAELADLARFRDEMNALPARDFGLEATSPSSGSGAFFRWALPLAAAVSLGIGALWWTITLRQQASPIVRLRDGSSELALSANGRSLTLRHVPPVLQDAIAEAFLTGKIALPPPITELAGSEQTLAGPADEHVKLHVLEPVATAVRDGKPRFVWSPLPEASAYRINILEESSGKLIASEELPADRNEWTPEEPLRAGERYEWEVQAIGPAGLLAKSPAPPEPEARFQVLSEAQRLAVEEEERLARGSHLVLGAAHARAGLVSEAVREFRILREENPNAELPRQWLAQLERRASR